MNKKELLLNIRDNFSILPEYIINECHLINPTNTTIVDVGSWGGIFTPMDVFKNLATFIGFEPQLEFCNELNKKEKLYNRYETHYPIALGNTNEIKKLNITKNHVSSSFLDVNDPVVRPLSNYNQVEIIDHIEVPVKRLDDFCIDQNINNIDFLKLDAEGYELEILKGGTDIIKNTTLGMYIEVYFQKWHVDRPLYEDINKYVTEVLKFNFIDFYETTNQETGLMYSNAFYLKNPLTNYKSVDVNDHHTFLNLLKTLLITHAMGKINLTDDILEFMTESVSE